MFASLRRSRGVVLRKFGGKLAAAFQFGGKAADEVAYVRVRVWHRASPMASLLFLAVSVLAVLAALAIGTMLGDWLTGGASLALVAPLVTKNRAANEFRDKANKIRHDLSDASKTYTAEEVERMTTEIRTIELRAQAAAEFTPDAEVARQGGDEGLVRIDVDGSGDQEVKFRGLVDASMDVRREIKKVVPTIGHYLRIVAKGAQNAGELALMKRVEEMTRAITGSTFGGEYLLPLTQVPEIFSVSNQQPGVMQYARRYSVPGRSLRIPYLIQDEGTSTLNRPMAGKIANVSIIGEGVTKPERDPSFGQRVLTMFKYAGITQFADEILSDDFTGELPGEVTAAVGGQIVNAMNEDVTIDGGGTTEPVGALNAANTALLEVDRTTASSFVAADAFAMYEQHTHGPNSVWMISRRVLSKLMAMQTTNNTMVTWISNLRDKPVLMLLGLPVIVTDLLNPLGTKGDVALINGDFYALGLRQALTVESSIHAAFINDLTTYRFVARGGGIPLPTSTYAYKVDGSGNKVDPHSPFVVLDVPASS